MRGSRSFFRLERATREVDGYRRLIPTHQGRGAEHLLGKVLVQPGQLVPSNLYFTTSREHAKLAGARWADVSIPEAQDPTSTHPFKGNLDLAALENVLRAAAPERVAFVRIEACLNMAGGQPFSIANMAGLRELTNAYGVPLILDATRISENAVFVPIVVPVGAHAVFLDAKRFLPHVPQEAFPAPALAAALYLAGGIRSLERGIVSGSTATSPTMASSSCG